MTEQGPLRKIGDSLDYLLSVVSAESRGEGIGLENLLDIYLETRRVLTQEFMVLARALIGDSADRIDDARARIEAEMAAMAHGTLGPDELRVGPYGGVHPVLLEYLVRHVGHYVPASRLRVLTGDQVHTERRVRELRDLGFDVDWQRVSDEDQYILRSLEPDISAAATAFVEKLLAKKGR